MHVVVSNTTVVHIFTARVWHAIELLTPLRS